MTAAQGSPDVLRAVTWRSAPGHPRLAGSVNMGSPRQTTYALRQPHGDEAHFESLADAVTAGRRIDPSDRAAWYVVERPAPARRQGAGRLVHRAEYPA